jgi:hypothetical protein
MRVQLSWLMSSIEGQSTAFLAQESESSDSTAAPAKGVLQKVIVQLPWLRSLTEGILANNPLSS